MSDFISKKELYHKLGEAYNKGYLAWGANEIIKDILGVCDSVEKKGEDRPKGHWIRFKEFEEGYFHIKCSKCGQYWSIDSHAKIFKYCFNCGADMRGEAEHMLKALYEGIPYEEDMEQGTKTCPICKNVIKDAVKECPYCHCMGVCDEKGGE